jgi:hypothetical protein
MNVTNRRVLLAGLAIIALTNAVVLGGAAYNRGGEADATLRLSERELRPARLPAAGENSGLALRLNWRVQGGRQPGVVPYEFPGLDTPKWLDREKMASLGFDVSIPETDADARRAFARELPRDVLLVLELEGPAYEEAVRAAKAQDTRLFVVDAGLDGAALRAKYPDRSRYAIVRGQVAPASARNRHAADHAGYVSHLSVAAINVPLGFRGAFAGAAHETVIAFGKRREPWIVEARGK